MEGLTNLVLIEFASEKLKADKEVVLEAVKQNEYAFDYVSEETRKRSRVHESGGAIPRPRGTVPLNLQ